LLVAAAAQKIAGPGKTPTSGQVRTAETKMKERLARRNVSVSGVEKADQQLGEVKKHLNECAVAGWGAGSFWSKVKSTAASAARASRPYLPYAAPLLPAAAATPFIIKAIRAREAAKRARAAQMAPSPEAEAPPAEEPAAEEPAAEAPLSTPEAEGQVPQGEGLESVAGNWGGWDEREMMSGVTAEERELALMGGSAEREALVRRALRRRRRSRVSGAALPHDLYRAAVWQRAQKLKKAGQPQARALFIAQKSVDRDMSRSGVSVAIPGARPGRITR